MVEIRNTWPKGTSFDSIRDEIYNQLVRQANDLVDDLSKKLLSIQTPSQTDGVPPASPTPLGTQTRHSSLPWFKHGVRGFLRKLWYGDHPSNPDWKNDWTSPRMTIQECIQLERQVDTTIDGLLQEANLVDAFRNYVNEFKKKLSELIRYHMSRLYQVGWENGQQSAAGTSLPTDRGEASPTSPPEPTSEPTPKEPEPTRNETPPPPGPTTSPPTAAPPPEPTEIEPRRRNRDKRKEPTVKPDENLNPLQAILNPRAKNNLRKRPPLKLSELELALRFLHEHGYDITSPIDVIEGMTKLASVHYKGGGNLLALYGKAAGLDPNDDNEILAHLGIEGLGKSDSEHASVDEIQAEIDRLTREKEESGYDYKGTEGEPGNYSLGEPEEERFD